MTNIKTNVKTDAIDYLLSVFFVFVFLHTKIRFSYDIERSGEIALPNVWVAWNGTDIETALTVKSTLGVTLSANVPGGIKIPYFTQKDMYLHYQRSCHSKFWGTFLVVKEVYQPVIRGFETGKIGVILEILTVGLIK